MGAGGVQYYMPQNTDCWSSCSGGCSSSGAYDTSASAPCTNPRTRTVGGVTCYHCDAVCSDLGAGWTDQNSGGTSSAYSAGQSAGGYTFAASTTCWLDPGCLCSTCTQSGGGTWYACSGGGQCEYLPGTCADWGYESSSNPGAGYKCTPQNVAVGSCSTNDSWAPNGLSCWSCTYTSTPFAPLGARGELVFIGLEIEESNDSFKNIEKNLEEFAPLGIDGAYVYTGALNF